MDRCKPGSKMHILSDAKGLPLLVGISAGNTHDSDGLKPMIEGHQTRHDPHRGRYSKPQRLHADKAYDRADLRRWLRWKRIGVRIARKGIESSERLGRRRWVIERTMSWLGYPANADSALATSAIPATTWPFSDSPPPCAATSASSASPHRTRSEGTWGGGQRKTRITFHFGKLRPPVLGMGGPCSPAAPEGPRLSGSAPTAPWACVRFRGGFRCRSHDELTYRIAAFRARITECRACGGGPAPALLERLNMPVLIAVCMDVLT